jgi:hypothetical protein
MSRRLLFKTRSLLLFAAALIANSSFAAWQMKQAPLMTQWTSQVDTNHPLPEYPRPQMERSNWLNLNGIWQFEPGITNSDPIPTNQTLSGNILVPYPMESAISGVMQYHAWSWYRTTFTVPSGWSGQRIILHMDAVTWQSQVYINGRSVGTHKGGYDPFSYDITPELNGSGAQELIVQVYSPEDNGSQPRGKQTLYPGGIMYTSSSGIWQPVWLEPVNAAGVQNLEIVPDIDNLRAFVTVNTYSSNGVSISATVLSNSAVIQTVSGKPDAEMVVPIPNPRLWSPTDPFLYGLQISVTQNGTNVDSVSSYFGMRKISVSIINGVPWILLNNQSIFQMGPLDQGYWPDGIYTASTDAALEFDIQEEKALGFNAIRKHEKVERQRWYYWADTLGMMIWQDMPTCNSYTGNPNPPAVNPLQFIAELSALVTNHWNSPAIIMWDVFNEGQGEQGSGNGVGQTNTAYLVGLVDGLDPARLVNEASGGNYFGVGDVLDNHSYPAPGDPASATQAAVDGEFGGIGLLVPGHLWNPGAASVGYVNAGNAANIAPEYDSFIDDLVAYKSGGLNAAIYTQITDVENECDGLLTYDRVVKPDPTRITVSNQKAITGRIIDGTNLVANTLTLPGDHLDYWPLDETNGTVAADLTGKDNGTVFGASWNSQGKVNGCLTFNGVNNYVQVNRDISNDFSIAFWVKTTATAGSGAWTEAAGLVDATTGSNVNDFGTALAGNQLALRTGNTGIILFSSAPINDGAWHYCVATRVQSTGAMQLYLDGNLEASGTGSTNSLTASEYMKFGAIQSGGGFFNGSLDEIKIYSRALGNLEIAALYEDGESPLAAPTNVTATAANGEVTLNWWTVPVATSYNVGRSVSPSGPFVVVANVSAPGYTDTNVVNGTIYYYVISSVDSAGAGAGSSEVSALPSLLNAWFAASAITGLANGAAVSNWTDLSGNGNNATRTITGNDVPFSDYPSYITNAMNGQPVVRFISTNFTYLSFNRPIQDDFTIMIVFQSTQNTQGAGTEFYQGAGLVNGDQPDVQNDFGTQLNANGQVVVGTGNPDTSINSGPGFNNGRPHVATFERTESTGALVLYVDGVQVASGTGGTESLTAPPSLDLGAVPSGGGFFSGDLAEVRLYSAALSASARQSAETALRVKYLGLVPPGLGMSAENASGLTLAWPANSGFNLYGTTNLTPPVVWSIVTNASATANGTNTLTLKPSGVAAFFELIDQ